MIRWLRRRIDEHDWRKIGNCSLGCLAVLAIGVLIGIGIACV
jgi:hypothetical protein